MFRSSWFPTRSQVTLCPSVTGEGVNQDVGAPGEALFSLSQLRGSAAAAAEQVL